MEVELGHDFTSSIFRHMVLEVGSDIGRSREMGLHGNAR